ncbi:TenA family protein [Segnochrobactrum spirostomi]|uniref:Aminopyrimidine aminohydrolase n=1 Tax=Segnochrobactrum spirostomi TaxID=2608987 RepID=A0A6A7Y9V0_9HYPH|nr:TenA family protein [Segnochrobactrum spirostomi]MQT15535.1 TenA family transcriptional regulator [Segnochrobactrum spirostomi]
MSETLSERILRENADVFAAMIDHRFVRDIEADRLPSPVFDRYLVYEGAFVETAVAIFAFAVARAPGMVGRRWFVGVLNALVNEQIVYFEQTFAARGIDPAAYDVRRPAVAEFRDGMLAIAEAGTYLDVVAAMFAAEWMYFTWCTRASTAAISDLLLKAWVDLHAAPEFEAQARFLKDTLDAAGPGLTEAEAARLSAVFGRAQALEIAFHEAAYAV